MFRSRFLASLMIGAALVGTASAQSGAVGTAAAPSDSQRIEGIAAIVNDAPISYSDVRERAQLLLLSLGGQPTTGDIQRIAGQALQQLIDEKLQLQEAAEYDVEIQADEIAASVEDMAAQSGLNRDELYRQLLASGINPASLEEQMRAEIAWRRIMGGLYGSRIRISDNQINEQLELLKASAEETQYLISEIFLFEPDPTNQGAAVEAANSIRAQLLEGAAFQVAAQRFSSAPTAATGGDMGWVNVEDIDPVVAAAVTAMPGPGITEPIVVDTGVYLIALRNKQEPGESASLVSLTRLLARDGDLAALNTAMAEIGSCDDIQAVADANDNLAAAALGRIALNELAPDAAERIDVTPVGSPTEVFDASGGQAVMYVCDRQDDVSDLPSPEQIENRLYGQQLGRISERALRDLRREATIIQRDE